MAVADGSSFLLALPDDVLALMSLALSPVDLCNLALACREFRSFAFSDKLWLPQCEHLLADHGRVREHLLAWRTAALPSFKSICKFLRLVRPLLGLWVHQNPELGNVVYALLGFASVTGCRIIPQELSPAGIDGGALLWAPVFEIVAGSDGSPLFFLHGREKDFEYMYPGSVKSLHPNCNILLLEVEPMKEAARLLQTKSLVQFDSGRFFHSRTIRRSETMIPRAAESRLDASFGKLGFVDRRKLLETVASRVHFKVPSCFTGGALFPCEMLSEDVARLSERRLALIEMYNKYRFARVDLGLGLESSDMKNVLDQPDNWIGEEGGSLKFSKSRSLGRYFRNGLKQIFGRTSSMNDNSCSVGGTSCSNTSSSSSFLKHGSSSSDNKHIQLAEFLKLGDTVGLSLQASKVKLTTYRAWPNMLDNKFALYKLPLQNPSPGREYAGLWGGTFGWPPGQHNEDKLGKALFLLLLSYDESEGHVNLIGTKILEGTHYVLHPNGSAIFSVKVDEPSWDAFPWSTGSNSAGMEIKCAYNGEGIASGYGFRYPGSKPGSLFVTQCGLLIFVWKESRTVLTLQRLHMEELLRKGERVQALPPIANFVYLTKSFSNVFTDFWSTTSYFASSRCYLPKS
ncbi:F-box protein At5g39450-like [Aristolochia californica]|uniref:F-box protein At5g39450-like n=1 Tax=Aristolochia californica TaxID=171875 RepID=UPI0035DDA3C2